MSMPLSYSSMMSTGGKGPCCQAATISSNFGILVRSFMELVIIAFTNIDTEVINDKLIKEYSNIG